MDAGQSGNVSVRPLIGRQSDNGMLQVHAECIHCVLVQHPLHLTQSSLQVAGFNCPLTLFDSGFGYLCLKISAAIRIVWINVNAPKTTVRNTSLFVS
jgi:hypothetical protein